MKSSSLFKKLSALSLLLFLGLMSSVMAVYTGSNSTYTLTDTTVPGEINGYTGTLPAHLVIPLKNDAGVSITKINASVFNGVSTITTLTLPTSLIEIGVDAFKDCDNLYSVFIPDNVTIIGIGAFADCDKLVSITSANNSAVYATEDGILYDIKGATAILLQYPAGRPDVGFNIPSTISAKNVAEVTERAFEGNKYLLSIKFDNNITTVGEKAFFNSQSLSRVIFDTQVTGIGANAFTYNGTGNGTLAHATFLGNKPSGTIGSTPFAKAASTFEVRFIQGRTGFTAPTWTVNTDTYNSRIIRQTTNGELTYRINAGSVEILSVGTTANATLSIPQAIDGIPVRYVAPLAFVGDPALTSVQLPTSLTTIGQDAFYGCTLLDSVGLLPTVSVLDIPANIISLGVGAFGGCPLLVSIQVSDANNNYQAVGNVLYDRSLTHVVQFPINGPTSYEMPGTITNIDERAFEGNTSLESIELGVGQKVTSIGRRAFYNNTSLVTVRFGIVIDQIGDEAFACVLGALNEAIFYGQAPDPDPDLNSSTNDSKMGENVFKGAPSTFKVSCLPKESTFKPGNGTWTPNPISKPAESYTLANYTEDSDFMFDVKTDNSVEVTGYAGTPPARGGNPIGQVRIDYTTLPDTRLSFSDAADRTTFVNNFYPPGIPPGNGLGLNGNKIPLAVGENVYQADTGTVWYVESKIDYAPAGGLAPAVIPSIVWKIRETDGRQLTVSTDYALGTTVLVQDSVGPKVWQKVAFPGTNATDWIEVNFGIPNTIAGRPVTSIKANAFKDNDLITSMVLPASLSKIGVGAFYDCDLLGFLTYHAIFIPASVTTIGDGAFSACSDLDSFFVHPSSANFSSLDGVLFDKGQSSLLCYPAGAPVGSYTIPGTVKYIANQAFQNNKNIVTIELSDTIETIGERAFFDSQALVQVILGKGVTKIGKEAFANIRVLGSAVFNGNAPIVLGAAVFDNASDELEVEYYDGYAGWAATTPAEPAEFRDYKIVVRTQLGDYVYKITPDKSAIEIIDYIGSGGNLTIPAVIGVKPIRFIGAAFKNKTNLKTLSLPNTVAEIKANAFQGASNLSSIIFGSGLTTIGSDAFKDCNALTKITIPPSVTKIEPGAFSSCVLLATIDVDLDNSVYRSTDGVVYDKNQTILYHYPAGKKDLTTFTTPDTVITVADRAFEGNVYIAQLEFSKNVTTIGNGTCYNTVALAAVRFGSNATLGKEAFAGVASPLISAHFFGNGTIVNMTGGGVFGGALDDFKVYCLPQFRTAFGITATSTNGTWTPASGNSTISYNATIISELDDFKIDVINNGSEIKILEYTGLNLKIKTDFDINIKNIAVGQIFDNFVFGGSFISDYPLGTLAYDRQSKRIYIIEGSTEENGYRYWSEYTRFSLPKTTPLGYVVADQDGLIYQKVANDTMNENWIKVNFEIPETIAGLNVTEIDGEAFLDNTVITSVVLPTTLEKIGDGAFRNCDGLTSVFLPPSLTSFGNGTFADCDKLKKIFVDTSNTKYKSSNSPDINAGVLFDKTMNTLVQYPAGRQMSYYATPSTVTKIQKEAFMGNMYLNSLIISDACVTIGVDAFKGSLSLVSVTVGKGVSDIGLGAFANIPALSRILFQGDAPENVDKLFKDDIGEVKYKSKDFEAYYYPSSTGWNDLIKDKIISPIGNWNSGLYKTSNGFHAVGIISQAKFNKYLGGHIEASVNRNGIATGTIKMVGTSGIAGTHRFIKGFDDKGELSVTIQRRGESDLILNLKLDLAEAPERFAFRSIAGNTLKVGIETPATIEASSVPWNSKNPATAYGGFYTVGLITGSNTSKVTEKQGYGFLTFNVKPATGAISLKGVLADGTKVTGSSVVTEASTVDGIGVVPMWMPLYSSKGILFGSMTINSTKSVTANLKWSKPKGVAKSPHAAGFKDVPLTAIAGSGLYVEPSIKKISQSFKLTFDNGTIDPPPPQSFKVSNGQISETSTKPIINVQWDLGTGVFQGTFNDSKKGSYMQGVILNHGTTKFSLRGNYQYKEGTGYYSGSVKK